MILRFGIWRADGRFRFSVDDVSLRVDIVFYFVYALCT